MICQCDKGQDIEKRLLLASLATKARVYFPKMYVEDQIFCKHNFPAMILLEKFRKDNSFTKELIKFI